MPAAAHANGDHGEPPGERCLLFAFGEDVVEPGLIRIIERWRDWAALAAHDTAPHVVTGRAALKEIGVISRDLMAHEATNGRAI